MANEKRQLASPVATGGGGHDFEIEVQCTFVVLMLSGGVAPGLPPWPIISVQLQGRPDGYETDDLIVLTEEAAGRKAKMLGQIRSSVKFTPRDRDFGDVMAAALHDFRNQVKFNPDLDVIALLTGPLSEADMQMRVVLEWARHIQTAKEFLDKVRLAKFSSEIKANKLEIFREHLKNANGGDHLADEELWRFLKCYRILIFDLDIRSGIVLSLLHSYIAQFHCEDVAAVWGECHREVAQFNKNAGTMTRKTLSASIQDKFAKSKPPLQIPSELAKNEGARHPAVVDGDKAKAVMLASLLGGLDEKMAGDVEVAKKLIK